MGLAEKRALNDFQEKHFAAWEKKIHAAVGFAVPIEVKWDQLTKSEYGHLYQEAWEKVYFAPLMETFKEVGKDDLGRKALKAGLKKIVICFTDTNYTNIGFADGVLTVDHDPVSNIDSGKDRVEQMVKLLENGL